MAIQYDGTLAKETFVRFSLELPGLSQKLDLYGELAWEDSGNQAGVRFTNLKEEQRTILRQWLNCQLPEPEQDDPPIDCSLTNLSTGGCYLKTESPFPKGTRVILSKKTNDVELRAGGIVRVAHPEFGMGVEFIQATSEQREQAQQMIETLRSHQARAPELQVAPDGLETSFVDRSETETGDSLVDLFRQKAQVPVDLRRPGPYTRNAYESVAWTRAVYRHLAGVDAMASAQAGRAYLTERFVRDRRPRQETKFRKSQEELRAQPRPRGRGRPRDSRRGVGATVARLGPISVFARRDPPRLSRKYQEQTRAALSTKSAPEIRSQCPEARLPPSLSCRPELLLRAPPGVWRPVRRAGQLPPRPPPCRTPSGSSCTCRTAPRRSWVQ